MTVTGSAQPQYYAHSGKFTITGILVGILVGLVTAFVTAWVYVYAVVYVPFVYLNILLCLGFAVVVGLSTAGTMAKLKVRNGPVMVACSMLVSLAALYVAWCVYIYAIFRREDADVALTQVLFDPAGVWEFVQELNKRGYWSFGKGSREPVKGVMLWIVWLVEAGIIFAMTAVGVNIVLDDPFCEPCGRWTKGRKNLATLSAADLGTLMPRLEAKDFSVVAEHPYAGDGPQWVRLDMHHCANPACGATHALTATLVTLTVNKGEQSQSERTLFSKLLLTREENDALVAALQTPATPEAPPPPPPPPPVQPA